MTFFDYSSLLKKFNACMESIAEASWCGNGPTGIFANRDANVLAFTHQDLDGIVSGSILKNFYHNIDLQFINYGKLVEIQLDYARNNADKYDCIVFTDFTPPIDSPNGPCGDGSMFNEFKSIGLPILVIDHHEKVAVANNPDDNVFIVGGKCGAYRTLEYFSKACPELHKFDDLCEYTNTHDLFLGKTMPEDHALHAKRLNSLSRHITGQYPDMDFNRAVDRFYDGNPEFSDDELSTIIGIENKEEMDYQNQEKIPLKGNGVLVTNCENFSAINPRLDEDGYAYAIHKICKPDINKMVLSFRFYPDNFPEEFKYKYDGDKKAMEREANVNVVIGKIAAGEGGVPMDSNGGGGHANAGGRPCTTEEDMDAYIEQYTNVVGKMFSEDNQDAVVEPVAPDDITPDGFN